MVAQPRTEDSLRRMVLGPGLMVLARVGGALAAMGFTMLLTRSMGAAAMSEVSVAISLAMVLALGCTLNIEEGAVRFMVQDITAGRFAAAMGYVRFGRRLIALACLGVVLIGGAVLWWLGTPLTSPLFLALLAAPVLGWMRLGAGLALGFGRPVASVLPRTLLRPVFMVILVGLWLALVGTPSPWVATLLFVATCLAALTVQGLLLSPDLTALGRNLGAEAPDTARSRDWVKVGLTLGLGVLFVEYSIYLTVLFGALVLSPADTARLDVLLKLIALLRFSTAAINQYFSPRMSRAMGQTNLPALERLIALSGAMRLAILLVGGLGIALLGPPVLGLFGPEFAGDGGLLLLLLGDIALITLFGPGANVVGYSNRPHAMLPVLLAALVVMVGGTVALGQVWGLTGVIVAVLVTRAVWTGGAAIAARRIAGIDTTILSLPRYLTGRRA